MRAKIRVYSRNPRLRGLEKADSSIGLKSSLGMTSCKGEVLARNDSTVEIEVLARMRSNNRRQGDKGREDSPVLLFVSTIHDPLLLKLSLSASSIVC